MNLQDLVATHRAGRTNPELARDCGSVFSDKRMQQLATGAFKEFPEPKTIRALATGLRVSETAVIMSIAESLELDVRRPNGGLLDLLPASASDLPENQARAIATLVYEFTVGAQKEGGSDGGTPEDQKSDGEDDGGGETGGATVTPIKPNGPKGSPATGPDPMKGEPKAAEQTPGKPSQYEQVTRDQDLAGEENQDPDSGADDIGPPSSD